MDFRISNIQGDVKVITKIINETNFELTFFNFSYSYLKIKNRTGNQKLQINTLHRYVFFTQYNWNEIEPNLSGKNNIMVCK